MAWIVWESASILTAIASLKSTSINNGGTVLPAATSLYDALTFQHQSPMFINDASPISDTYETVLDTTTNVRILSIYLLSNWAVTQPTPITVKVTIDGITLTGVQANPISGTYYYVSLNPNSTSVLDLTTDLLPGHYRAFLLEGRSIKVEAKIAWGVTQPSLACMVKYAKR